MVTSVLVIFLAACSISCGPVYMHFIWFSPSATVTLKEDAFASASVQPAAGADFAAATVRREDFDGDCARRVYPLAAACSAARGFCPSITGDLGGTFETENMFSGLQRAAGVGIGEATSLRGAFGVDLVRRAHPLVAACTRAAARSAVRRLCSSIAGHLGGNRENIFSTGGACSPVSIACGRGLAH
jgi:hypothetical protein